MAFDLFKQYGIKEVADVTIYKVTDAGEVPYLFLDTLKVSTIEQTAEQSDARGGKGNPKLITWDFGKEINVTLEDALYSPASMALMFAGDGKSWVSQSTVTKMLRQNHAGEGNAATTIADGNGKVWTVKKWIGEDGVVTTTAPSTKGSYMVEVEATVAGHKLVINADDFPGTYKIVGDTYARNRDTGVDEYFQFIIPRAKMSSDQTLTLEAEGDPTTFNLNLTVLKPATGEGMIELVQYAFDAEEAKIGE